MLARVRDTEIYFDVDGMGLVPDGSQMRERPTAFLIHGGPGGDHSGYKVALSPLKEKMQLVYFDHRGHGRSARGNPEKYTLDENVEDMEALRQHLGLGPIVSVGLSYGGVVAMAHAARYPKSVSHLVLGVTISHAGYVEKTKQFVAEHGTPEQIAQCDAMFAGQLDTPEKYRNFLKVTGNLYAVNHKPGDAQEVFDRMIFTTEPLNRAHGPGGFMRSLDLRPELAAITAPTLIVGGRKDWICAAEFSEELHRLIPGSDLCIFEDSSHIFEGANAQKFLDAVAGFVVYKKAESA